MKKKLHVIVACTIMLGVVKLCVPIVRVYRPLCRSHVRLTVDMLAHRVTGRGMCAKALWRAREA